MWCLLDLLQCLVCGKIIWGFVPYLFRKLITLFWGFVLYLFGELINLLTLFYFLVLYVNVIKHESFIWPSSLLCFCEDKGVGQILWRSPENLCKHRLLFIAGHFEITKQPASRTPFCAVRVVTSSTTSSSK